MKIIADLNAGRLILPDAEFSISNQVRSLWDGTRRSYEVIRSIPDNLPYDPMHFPRGLWQVTGVEWQKERCFDPRTYGPVKIRTDAWQWVKVWDLDMEGDYLRETDQQARDTCYWLHYSDSKTTLGCIRLASPEDAASLAMVVARALEREPVELEVA
jgi:hypothetical protein